MTANTSGGRVGLNTIAHMDAFDLCDCLEDDSIDMILADLPYAITALKWDTIIPFEPMWECFKRIVKPRGAIVLTASGKFTYKLAMSNFEWFKYEWVWEKTTPTGFLDAYKQPLKYTERILIFGNNRPDYYPQYRRGIGYNVNVKYRKTAMYGSQTDVISQNDGTQYFPKDIIKVSNFNGRGKQHPTQKPVALFEYLIRTYTQPGETVFDPCVGSGTTAIAARNTGRNYIVGDSSEEYCKVARERLAEPYTLPMFDETVAEDKPVQAVMEL